jgi:hypothetical protein
MKMVKSLLLGAAAGLVGVAGAQAADLPVKAKPVQYVKICSLYGAGFYYMPGTDTCLKVGGYVRAEVNFNAANSFAPNVGASGAHSSSTYFENNWRTRAAITLDARSQTEYGTLRAYLLVTATDGNSNGESYAAPNGIPSGTTGFSSTTNAGHAAGYTRLYAPSAFIQFAGFTAGKTDSFFNFDTQPYSNQSNYWGSNQGGNGVDLFAYTAQFGNGLSASIAAENNNGHRLGITATNANTVVSLAGVTVANTTYGGQGAPDIVGNLRIDQAWGSAQVMGAAHELTFAYSDASAGVSPSPKWGYAFGAGLKLNAPMFGKGDYVIAEGSWTKGATSYVASGASTGSNNVSMGGVTTAAPFWDAVITSGNGTSAANVDLTTAWSVTAGYEHFWNTQWKTSLYGAYGAVKYSDAANLIVGGTATSSANWNYWQVGSRTVWTPVTNLDLSVEVMYQKMDNDLTHTATVGSNDWFSGIFRVQRNFYP